MDVFKITSLADVEALEREPLESRQLPASTYELLQRSAERFGDDTALRFIEWIGEEQLELTFSYRDLLRRVTQTANALTSLGVDAEHGAALLLPNLPETHFALWGAEAAGVCCPINPLLEPKHIVGILNESGCRALITLAPNPILDLWSKVEAIAAAAPDLQHIILVAPPIGADANLPELPGATTHDFKTLVDAQPDEKLTRRGAIGPEDLASYFHTGGTTGAPKLAPHSHRNEVVNAWQMGVAADIDSDYVGLCGLPLFHVNAAMVTGLTPFLRGAEVLLAGFAGYRNPALMQNFWSIIERHRVSFFSAVPTILSALGDIPSDGRDLSSLKFCICGAAPLAQEAMRRFEKKTGLTVIEGYGLTESNCACAMNPRYGEHRIGSVGIRLPYSEVKTVILNERGEWERDCLADEPGVVAIRGPNVFAGYKNPEHDRGTWIADDWLNSGDLGHIDEQGYIHLSGRSKDIIIRGGHNIDPQIIEEVLHQHDAVLTAAAVGRPDKKLGEMPMAYVQLKPGADVDEEAIAAFAKERIAERAAAPKVVRIVDAMPVTAVGKIFKPELRNLATREVIIETLREAGLDADELDIKVDTAASQSATISGANESQIEKIGKLLSDFNFELKTL